MSEFRDFFQENCENDARLSMSRLPKSHRNLLRGFKIKFQSGDTLKNDKQHIGKVDGDNIVIAAPFFYPREFAFLHEIGHLVWAKYVEGTPLQEKWHKLCSKTKNKIKQNYEEIFCHSYATTYSKHKIEKHNHPELEKFILELPK